MKILPVNKHTIDVFKANGWEDWGRFKINRNHQGINVFQTSGTPFSKQDKLHIINQLAEKN